MIASGVGAFASGFLASLVEGVEALTVVLAVGAARGWRGALAGVGAGVALLAVTILVLGPALLALPIGVLKIGLGVLLLMFGLRWLRKAILRAGGVLALHDEDAAYAAAERRFAGVGMGVAFAAASQIVLLEGAEIVFIVVAIGAGTGGLALPAAGAAMAMAVVVALGLVLHRPVARLPENAVKMVVGVLLAAFGTFWTGEGFGGVWPGGDLMLPGLLLFWAAISFAGVTLCRRVAV